MNWILGLKRNVEFFLCLDSYLARKWELKSMRRKKERWIWHWFCSVIQHLHSAYYVPGVHIHRGKCLGVKLNSIWILTRALVFVSPLLSKIQILHSDGQLQHNLDFFFSVNKNGLLKIWKILILLPLTNTLSLESEVWSYIYLM